MLRFHKHYLEDVFGLKRRDTVATGRVERGTIKVGEQVEIVGMRQTRSAVVTVIGTLEKTLIEAIPGDDVGCTLRGVERTDVERGQVLARPGSIKAYQMFRAQVSLLSEQEGGRHTPVFSGDRLQFSIRTADITGTIKLPKGVEMMMPGDNLEITVELMQPVAMEEGVHFAIREAGRRVGAGVCTWVKD